LTEPALPDELSNQELVFSRLLGAVTGAFRSGRADVHVTPTAVLCRYQQLGIARPGHWVRPTLASLTHEVVQAVNLPSAKPRQDLQSLLHEIISLWRLFFQCMGPESDAFESISDDWSLPPLEELPDMYDSRDFNFRLQKHIPKYVSSPALGFCAVYLYSISDALDPTIHEKAAPFLRFLERLLAGSRVDSIFVHTESSQQFKVLPVDIQRQIRGEIDAAPRKALIALGKVGESPDEMTNLEAFHMKSIARVVESMTSRSKLDKIWEEVQQTYLTENKRVAIPRSVYNRFLSGYLVLYNSNRAVEVWNHMIAHGVQPDVQSWVALLEGCAKTKDLNGFNTTWQRMLNSGIEPENYAWTTRVNGLMSFRQINPALATLDDMGKRWLAAEQAINNTKTHNKGQRGSTRAVNRCTKPSIEVVNGAISAIVQIRPESLRHEKRVEYVQKILAWSTNFQIKPDAITYNSLIRLYLQAKDMRTAFRLLTQMEKDGVEADIATHTMLMSTAFENQVFDGQTEQQQTERILRMLDDLEANGLRLNHYVYSTAIDRVLKGYANYTAVRAIMEHMTSRNFTPSAHVYTSLITHYFQSEPPNLVEVDNVVNLLFTAPRMPSDRILYDRLIEGYALNSEVGKMMSVLTRMSKQGVLPGWGALIAVVQALVREGDYDRARDVVRDVARGEGVAKGGIMMDRTSEMAFRSLVNRLGLDEERMGDFMAGGRQRNSDSVVQHFTTERRVLDSPAQQEHASSGYANDDAAVGEDIHGFLAREHEPGLWG
jgi:pentatricopeptide repeat protein